MCKCSGVSVSQDQQRHFDRLCYKISRDICQGCCKTKNVIIQRSQVNGFDSQIISLPSYLLQIFNENEVN